MVIRKKTDKTMVIRKRATGKTIVYRIPHRNLKVKEHKPY